MAKPHIIGHIETLLKKTLGDSTMKLGEIESGTDIYSIVICRGYKHLFDEESHHHLVLFPFRIADRVDYWLSFSLKYNVWEQKVSNISIAYYDADYYKMFRAEWENNSVTEHAQPHWHIHNRNPDFESPLWDADAVRIFSEEVNEIISNKIKNIHFAMSSSWHTNENHIKNISDCEDIEIRRWIYGVLSYINHQLTYLNDKSRV